MKIPGQLHLLANNWIKVLQYATFKVRKFAPLFYKINTCLQRNSTCIGLQADQMLSVNTKYSYFSILGVGFAVPFPCYFHKLRLFVVKKNWNNFCFIVLLFVWAQKVSLEFLKFFSKVEDINIFVLRGVFFSRYVQLKSSFSDERNGGEIWDTF